MALVGSDLKLVMTGSGTTANPHLSLGGAPSTTNEVSTTSLNSIFDDINGDESDAGNTNYRILAVRNGHATDMAESVTVYLSANYSDFMAIGISEAVNANPQSISSESTAPSGVTFTSPSASADGLDIGTLTSGQFRALYVRRVIPASTTVAKDAANFTLAVEAQTET